VFPPIFNRCLSQSEITTLDSIHQGRITSMLAMTPASFGIRIL
jgi:hypothetical protein